MIGTTGTSAKRAAMLLLALQTLSGCAEKMDGTEEPTGSVGCPGNSNVDPISATDLAAGETRTGHICPRGNRHWFRITVPEGQSVVSVDLSNRAPLSPVRLSYVLREADGMTLVDYSPPPAMGSGAQSVRYSHCVKQPGTYLLEVQSFGNDQADTKNPFYLSYTTAPDPDSGEPANNTPAGAATISGQGRKGYIACKGDRDLYKITVPDSTLLEITLRTDEATPGMDLRYAIVDEQMTQVAEDGVKTGREVTRLEVVRTTPGAGTYYIIVSDQKDGASLKTPYTLSVSPLPEPDSGDRPVRNDVPASATALGTWTCGMSMPPFVRTAYLASRADTDWYKVTLAGVGPTCNAVIDVSVAWADGGGGVLPQISLVYPDIGRAAPMRAPTPCMKDEDCRTLNQGCSDDNGCEYLGHQCNRQAGRCTGAAVCLAGGVCGVLQFAKHLDTARARPSVHTAQPLVASQTYYIRVRDFQSLAYDKSRPYDLSVRFGPEEIHEPNNFYTPYEVSPESGRYHRDAGFQMRNKILLDQPYTGRISYERDRDYYVLDHPCPQADCTLGVTYSTSKISPVYVTYQMEAQGGMLWAGWPEPPMVRLSNAPQVPPTEFGGAGTNTCLYASRKHSGPYLLWVADLFKGGPLWDPDMTYTFTVRKLMDGCSDLCKTDKFKCGM